MAIFTGLLATVGGWFAGLSLQSFAVRLIAGLAFNALAKALTGKPDAPQGGIESQLQQGADLSRRFLLGRTATAGSLVYHNQWGGGSNEFYTRVTALSDLPISALVALWIDGERSEIDWANPDPDGKGYPLLGLSKTTTFWRSTPVYKPGTGDSVIVGYENVEDTVSQHFGWVRFHDGTQTTADSLLTGSVSTEERPWSADEVGRGVAYAVTTFKYDTEKFQGLPQIIFEVDGVPLYDPEIDDTGTGDLLPAVQAHAILSGMSWSGQQLYGPQTSAVMDATEWAAEVAKCRADVPGAATMTAAEKIDAFGSTTVPPRYRAGLEVDVSRPVAEVLEDIVSACNGRISHTGTRYRLQVGDPGTAVTTLTDGDILSTSGQSFAPFFPLAETVNSISATYPEPDENWQLQDAPPLTNADYEAEEGGRRLPTTVELTAVPYREQVQRLMASALAEARRARRHSVTLPASYWALEVGDFIEWTSARNGYDAKLMRVDGLSDMEAGDLVADLTEVDPTDYDWTAATDYTPVTTGSITDQPLPAWTLSGWSLSPVTLRDGDGAGRRPAVLAEWTDPDRARVRGIRWQLRLAATGEVVGSGVIDDVEAEAMVLPVAVLPDVAYQGRAQIRSRSRASTWTAWASVTTPDVRLGESDLDDPLTTAAVPTGLSLSTSLLSDGLARIVVSWSAASGAVAYEIGVTQSGGSEVVLPAGDTTQHLDGLPGITYSIRVRSVSAIGSKSAWTTAQSITSAADSTPPGTPTGLTATGGFNTIWVEWGSVAASDLSHYELCVKTSSGTPGTSPTSPVYDVVATAFVHSGLGDDVTRYYYVRAVDTSGNKSGWSSVASATTSSAALVTVTAADIEGIVESTSFASGLTAVGVVSTLPADNSDYDVVALTTDSKLYRWDTAGSEWTRAVDGDDLVADSVTTAALSAGAVKAEQLDVGAVTARSVGIGDFTNFVAGSSGLWDSHPWSIESDSHARVLSMTDHTGEAENVLSFPAAAPSVARASIDRNLDVVPGEELYIEFWAYRSSTFDGSSSNSKLRIGDATTGAVLKAVSWAGITDGTWVKLTDTYVVADGVTALTVTLMSDHTVGYARVDDMIIRKKNAGEMIIDGALKANHVGTNELITYSANIADAIITDAKIVELAASKLYVPSGDDGIPATITVGTTGTTIGTVESRAADPASRINAASTKIEPGKITISGATTLDDWRAAGKTTIDGGNLETGTVKAIHVDATEIVVGGAELGGGIWSSDYVAGVSGWGIFPGGHAQLPATKIIGTLTANKLDLDGLVLENDGGSLTVKGGGIVTDHIGGNAVSQVAANSKGADEIVPDAVANAWEQVLTSGNATWLGGKPLLIMATINVATSYGTCHITYRIKVNGSIVYTGPKVSISGTLWLPISVAYEATSVAGTSAVTIETWVSNDSGGDTTVLAGSTIAALELKR